VTLALAGMNNRGIGLKYIFSVERETSDTPIHLRVTNLEIDDVAWPSRA
jgi:hypothetical protein